MAYTPSGGRPPALLDISQQKPDNIHPVAEHLNSSPEFAVLKLIMGRSSNAQTNWLYRIVIEGNLHTDLGPHLRSITVPLAQKCFYLLNFAIYTAEQGLTLYFRKVVNGHTIEPKVRGGAGAGWGHGRARCWVRG